jgi:hypothetical protein
MSFANPSLFILSYHYMFMSTRPSSSDVDSYHENQTVQQIHYF